MANHAWVQDIDANLSLDGWLQCILLWEALDNVQIDPSRSDSFRWIGSTSGVYLAKATYKSLREECLFLCTCLFGDRMPRSNANSFVGWQSSTDFGHQIEGRVMACRHILMFVSLVLRSRIMWSTF
jgi:hypothetical protein